MNLRERVLAWLRVPAAPSAPAGDQDVTIFRAAPNYMIYRGAGWLLSTAAGVIGLLFALGFAADAHEIIPAEITLGVLTITEPTVLFILALIEGGAIAGFIAQAAGRLLLLRFDWEQRWYIVSDRSLRTREGLLRLHEKTITFANVQHVSIRQGPLQRILGLADLQIRTAGGGGSEEGEENKDDAHVAYFRGIADAAGVRDLIRERLRLHRDAGLGDPDDVAPAVSGDALVEASRLLAVEAREMAGALSRNRLTL